MLTYKKILVAVDLTSTDIPLLQYTSLFSRLAQTESVELVFVDQNIPSVPGIQDQYPDLSSQIRAKVEEQLAAEVKTHYTGVGQAAGRMAIGSPMVEVIKRARAMDADLIVAGIKPDGAAGLAAKLARKAPCSVLIVPETAPVRLDAVLVPVDLSEASREALRLAAQIVSARGLSALGCLHAYDVPAGYSQTGMPREKLEAIVLAQAEKEFAAFLQTEKDLPIVLEPKLILDEDPVRAIFTTAQEQNTDLIVMGSHGRTALSVILLGSVTEGVVTRTDRPVLVSKNKAQSQRVLDALLQG